MKITQLPASTNPLPEVKGGGVPKEVGDQPLPEEDYTVYRDKVFSDGKDSQRKSKVFVPDVAVYRKKTFET